MYCKNCGSEIPQGADHCPNCGEAAPNEEIKGFTPVQEDPNVAATYFSGYDGRQNGGYNTAQNGGYNAGFGGQQNYNNTDFNGNYQYGSPYQNPYEYPTPLRTDRNFWTYFLLSIITCGIYGLVFLHYLVKDVNKACEGDGKHTSGILLYIVLSYLTCGIYGFIWLYQLGNRLAENGRRYGYNVVENGTSVLMWALFGSLLCGIGPLIAMNIIITNTNTVCDGYNRTYGFG